MPRAIKRLYWEAIEVVLALRVDPGNPDAAAIKGRDVYSRGIQGGQDPDGPLVPAVIFLVDTEAEAKQLRAEGAAWVRKVLAAVRLARGERPHV